MSGYEAHPPELIPILSRGKHRSPRQGACFMELVSFLAGERWSDHPACTHPLLAAVARDVNDYTSNAGRPRLAELIPSVIGLTGEDLHIDARIALVCAQRALPVVAAERQQTMAPHAAQWARSFTRDNPISPKAFRHRGAPTTVRAAVEGIALACVPQPDAMLLALLSDATGACATWACRDVGPDTPRDSAAWAAACSLTGTAGTL